MNRDKEKSGQSTSRASRKTKKPLETPGAAESRKKQKELQEKICNENLDEQKMEVRQPFKGTVGKSVPLVTNCFGLGLQERDLYVYDVAIKHQNGQEMELNGRLRNELLWSCLRQNRLRRNNFNLNQILFDDNHCLITIKQIPNLERIGDETSSPLNYNGPFGSYNVEVIVRYKCIVQIPSLPDGQNTEPFSPIQKYSIQNAITQFRRMPEWWLSNEFQNYPNHSIWVPKGNCFVRTQLNYGSEQENLFSKLYGQRVADGWKMQTHMINGNMKNSPPIISNVYKLYRGLVANVNIGSNGQAMVTLGIKHKLCPNFELPLIQYYAFVETRDEIPYDELVGLAKDRPSLNDDQVEKFNAELKGMKLKTIFDPQERGTFETLFRQNAIDYYIRPGESVFEKVSKQNGINYKIKPGESVFENYQRHGIKLRFPYLQLVKLKGLPFPFPIEMLKIADERTKVIDVRNRIMRQRICKEATIDPAAYHSEVSNLANRAILNHRMGQDDADTAYNPQMNAFGISILNRDKGGKMEPIEVEGRVLPKATTFQSTNDEEESLEKGVLEAAPVTTLIACTVNLLFSVDKDKFVRELAFVAHEKGIEFENKENVTCMEEDFNRMEDVQAYIRKHKVQHPDKSLIFLFILGGKKDNPSKPSTAELYSWIKTAGDNLEGAVTQCVNAENLREMQGPKNSSEYFSMIKSIAGKMNVKLGGVVNKIMEEARSECNEVFAKYTTADAPSLFLGIFSTKPLKGENRKSIVSVSFNINLEATRFANISDFAEKGTDFFEELTYLFLRALTVFKKVGQPPVNIFIFRGGLVDNLSKHIAEFEMEKFLEAWMQYEVNNSVHLPNINLHYLVVDRAHCLRFFLKDIETKKVLNPERGTVIDSDITAFGKNQFFLCSHETKQATVRPSCYTLSWFNKEGVRPDPDDLQLLIYALCFLVQRAVGSVASPAPLHYARLTSDRALYYVMANPDSYNLSVHPSIEYKNYVN